MPSFDFSVQWRCRGFVVAGLSGHLPAHHFGLNILGVRGQRPLSKMGERPLGRELLFSLSCEALESYPQRGWF